MQKIFIRIAKEEGVISNIKMKATHKVPEPGNVGQNLEHEDRFI
jgi:hypothetical protein